MKIIRPLTINDAALVSSNVSESDYAAYSAVTTYALGDRVIYVVADTHWIIESLQNSNTGHTPSGLTTDTWWLKVGNTNKWKMFDQSVQSQTSNADSIAVSLQATGRADSVVLLNVNAASVTITQTDNIDGLVYNKTFSLVSNSGITDWYAYLFEPIVRKQDFFTGDMFPYTDALISITLNDTGATPLCGGAIIGLSKDFGGTQYGLTSGITDYSVKQQDVFGNYTILERAYRKRSDMTVWMQNSFIDQAQVMLASYRSIPTVYVGSDLYANSIIYGFFRDFSIAVNFLDYSICTINIEGLT